MNDEYEYFDLLELEYALDSHPGSDKRCQRFADRCRSAWEWCDSGVRWETRYRRMESDRCRKLRKAVRDYLRKLDAEAR